MSSKIRLGFIPLIDCAALVVAKERGLFAAEGLEVQLYREPSWANIRDKLCAGLLEGAHALAPLVLATRLGLCEPQADLTCAFELNRGGAGVTISKALAKAIDGAPGGLPEVLKMRRARGAGPLTFGIVFPYSIHNYLLRTWLQNQDVSIGEDIHVVVAPPAQMAQRLGSGELDGVSVGAPWNLIASEASAGVCVAKAITLWPDAPDKVFAVQERWARANPTILASLRRAIILAAEWADKPANREELAKLLESPAYVGEPAGLIFRSLADDGVAFTPASPGLSSEALDQIRNQMIKSGQLAAGSPADLAFADLLAPSR